MVDIRLTWTENAFIITEISRQYKLKLDVMRFHSKSNQQ